MICVPHRLTALPVYDKAERKRCATCASYREGKVACHISLEKFGLLSFFEMVETGSPEGSRKPEAIRTIISSFNGVTKEETIYIGDSAGDIRESHTAGIRAVAAAWADTVKEEDLKKEKPDELFTTIPAFADWLFANV